MTIEGNFKTGLTFSHIFSPTLNDKPNPITKIVLSFLHRPISIQYGGDSPTDLEYYRSNMDDTALALLDQAHSLTQLLTGIEFGQINKFTNQIVNSTKEKILELMISFQNYSNKKSEYRGRWYLSYLVSTGSYLKLLQLYFSMRPVALYNEAFVQNPDDYCRQFTILHCAVYTNSPMLLSRNFIEFILQINKKHRLGLARMKDVVKDRASDIHRLQTRDPDDEVYLVLKKAEKEEKQGRSICQTFSPSLYNGPSKVLTKMVLSFLQAAKFQPKSMERGQYLKNLLEEVRTISRFARVSKFSNQMVKRRLVKTRKRALELSFILKKTSKDFTSKDSQDLKRLEVLK